MDRQKFAFDKTNFILLAIGMAVIIVGFLLMTGPSSTEGYFECTSHQSGARSMFLWLYIYDLWHCPQAKGQDRSG